MYSALKELGLAKIWVVYPGRDIYSQEKNITAVGLNSLDSGLILPGKLIKNKQLTPL